MVVTVSAPVAASVLLKVTTLAVSVPVEPNVAAPLYACAPVVVTVSAPVAASVLLKVTALAVSVPVEPSVPAPL